MVNQKKKRKTTSQRKRMKSLRENITDEQLILGH